MGLSAELLRNVTINPGCSAENANRIIDNAMTMENQQDLWVKSLRALDVKAAHPDDGWVNRTNNSVNLVYPQFNDGVSVGDLIALGWPPWSTRGKSHRIVRVIEISKTMFGKPIYHFQEVTQ